jgi:hypothetical protein
VFSSLLRCESKCSCIILVVYIKKKTRHHVRPYVHTVHIWLLRVRVEREEVRSRPILLLEERKSLALYTARNGCPCCGLLNSGSS